MKNYFLHDLGISLNLLLAGFFGALLLVRKEGKTLKENILTLVTGSFSAAYLAPFLIEILNMQDNKNALSFFGFITGFGSIKIVEFVMNKFFKKQEEDGNNN
jgi:hypothetical protein